jgi:hypothetical protein
VEVAVKPPYLDNPFAWLRTPRHGMTPAEFANPIEGFRRFSLWRALWMRLTFRN